MRRYCFITVFILTALCTLAVKPTTLLVDVSKGVDISPTMYGIFFEDINYGADGGLYAEMIKNRSFEFPQHFMGWNAFGNFELRADGPFENNPHFLRLSGAGHKEKHTGIENNGYFGMNLIKGAEYRFSVWARSDKPAQLQVQLVNPSAEEESVVACQAVIDVNSSDWYKYTAIMTPDRNVDCGALRLFLQKPDNQAVDIEHVSLFPVDTWQGHENGLRKDIVSALADLHPGVFRFPGGCIVEGTELSDRYQWKNTIGPVENRPTIPNRWQYTFKHRFAPDYYQSGGLGFYEYFLLAEELGAAPLPVLNVGMVCQYQNDDLSAYVPVDSLDSYIRDAIDLVEFANGDTTCYWGHIRSKMGHPQPFGLKYLAVGNEQWGKEYVDRLEKFVKTLREACPDIKIIGSSGPSPSGDKFDYLWPEMRRLDVDLVDEHYYSDEEWFKNNAARYDGYSRKGPKVFAGEYACHLSGKKRNSYEAALHEAAFMTGLERNADVVRMATYAPLLAHKKGWQWRPDLIWFDNKGITLTSSYHVQRLFGNNTGNRTAEVTINGKAPTGENGLYSSASLLDNSTLIVKIVNLSTEPRQVYIKLKALREKKLTGMADVTTMVEAPDNPGADSPLITQRKVAVGTDNVLNVTLPPESLSIYRIR